MRFWGRQATKQSFSDILAACLEEASSPEEIGLCLARYPEHAAELRPLLQTALSVRQKMAVPINEDRRLAARRQFLQAAARQSHAASGYALDHLRGPEHTPSVLLRPLWSAFAPAVAAALLFVVALIPIMSITSVSALPGDWNYGFKRSTERVRLALALDPTDRLDLQLAFHNRRLGEIERLAAAGRLNDPSLLQAFTSESSALLQTVSSTPQLGPSEALKVAVQTRAQTQALSDVVAPLASPSVRPAIENAVQESQQVQVKAAQVAQSKEDSATHPAASSATATVGAPAEATATATSASAATATAPVTATAAPASAATPTTAVLVPPAQAPLNPPPSPRTPAVTYGPPPPPPSVPQRSGSTTLAAPPTQAPPPPPTAPPSATPIVPPPQPANQPRFYTQPLPAGQQTTLIYYGAEMPVPQALASIAGAYDLVIFTQPRAHPGQVFEWVPGKSDPTELLEPGSQITIEIKPGVPATLSYPFVSSAVPSH